MTDTPLLKPRRVWIDTDPAITSGNGEVDDGYALLQALRSPELDVVGVSAVFGNTDIANTYPMAQEIVSRAGHEDVPVYRGHGTSGTRTANSATDALLDALAEDHLTIIALGPLTNIAAALSQPGAALGNVAEIIFVGGRRVRLEFRATPDQVEPFRDLNFELDAKAAAELLALGVPMTLAGWEVSSRMWLTAAHLGTLRTEGDSAVSWLSDMSQGWLRTWTDSFQAPGFTPFDTLAVGWIMQPDLFDAHRLRSEVVFTPDRPLFHADASIDGPEVTYLRSVDNDAFRADLMARLLNKKP
ncbi:MAG: nucleoside hydrolase [Pseudomonadota bacterium]